MIRIYISNLSSNHVRQIRCWYNSFNVKGINLLNFQRIRNRNFDKLSSLTELTAYVVNSVFPTRTKFNKLWFRLWCHRYLFEHVHNTKFIPFTIQMIVYDALKMSSRVI